MIGSCSSIKKLLNILKSYLPTRDNPVQFSRDQNWIHVYVTKQHVMFLGYCARALYWNDENYLIALMTLVLLIAEQIYSVKKLYKFHLIAFESKLQIFSR